MCFGTGVIQEDLEVDKLLKLVQEYEETMKDYKQRTEFFANMSHEIKTPLNIIMGAMQLIELYTFNGTIKDPENKLSKYMKNMKQNALRLLRIINNIIDLTKLDVNDISLELHNYDIVKIINTVIQSVEPYGKVKLINIDLMSEVPSRIIACDADKIERILLNLLSNAMKFTNEHGNITVSIMETDSTILFSVEDNGIGMYSEKLDTIFNRFRQVDKSFTRNREGSGIGLSIVKALVEMHKGNITVESEYGKGSRFTVELPLVTLADEAEIFLYTQYDDGISERVKVEFSDL